jgi:hypothetical protein
MTSIENLKSGMGSGLRNFFENYEDSINELIDNLDSDGLLLRNFSVDQINRLQNLTRSCNMALRLANDLNSVIDLNKTKRIEKIEHLKKAFNTRDKNRIGEHVEASLVHAYLAFLERLRIYLLFFINWEKLGKKHKDIQGIGNAISILRQKYPTNKYLNYFNSGARNSLAHYTFFWTTGGKIMLCSDILDKNPKEMPLLNLMKEINELNVLTEGFYMSLADKFGLPEITLDRLEK